MIQIMVLILLLLFSCVKCAIPQKTIVFVFSYHESYGTVFYGDPGAIRGLVQEGFLEGINLEVKRYYMDTKRKNTQHEEKLKVASQILHEISLFEYDVLATFDDNAFKYVGLNVSKSKPVVFTGLNGLPEFYNESVYFLDSRERPGHNITGVYEKLFVVEAVQVMSLTIPSMEGGRLMVITDNTTTGDMITNQVKSELAIAEEYHIASNVTFEYFVVDHFEDFEDLVLNTLNTNASFHAAYYAVFSLKVGTTGSTSVSSDVISDWIKHNSQKPDLTSQDFVCEGGLMGGLGPDYDDLGFQLGIKVGEILKGAKSAGEIPIGEPRHSIFLNKDRMQILGLEVNPLFEKFCNLVFYTPPSDDIPPYIREGYHWNPTWVIILLVLIVLITCCFTSCCCWFLCCSCCVLLCLDGCIFYTCCNWFRLRQKQKRFDVIGKHDLTRIVMEMKDAKTKSIPKIQVCKKLFQVPYKDIKLKGVVGKGGQNCIVYKVKWKGKLVAYKSFRTSDLSEDGGFSNIDEFEKEISILGSVFHPSLNGFYGIILEENRLGILMEYCANGDLQQYLYEQKLLESEVDVEVKIRWLREIADGMEYLHSKSIVHRDLKCKNILLNDALAVKIIDFGISRMITDDNMKTKRIGTSYYMAPEVTKGQNYGTPIDVFSFGIIMFEILTSNFNPYMQRGSEMYGIELKIANNPNFRPKFNRDDYPLEFSWFFDLMKACWNHDPFHRPSFELVREEMKRNMSGKSGKNQIGAIRQSVKRKTGFRKSRVFLESTMIDLDDGGSINEEEYSSDASFLKLKDEEDEENEGEGDD